MRGIREEARPVRKSKPLSPSGGNGAKVKTDTNGILILREGDNMTGDQAERLIKAIETLTDELKRGSSGLAKLSGYFHQGYFGSSSKLEMKPDEVEGRTGQKPR